MLEDKGILPPHNTDCEESLLGALLIDGENIKSVRISPEDFYYPQNQTVFNAMLQLKEKGSGVNQITVGQRLHETGKLQEIGGVAYLSLLISTCPTSLDCEYYADILRKLSTSRQLIAAGDIISSIGYNETDSTAAMAKADAVLLKLRQNAGGATIITPEGRTRLLSERYNKLFGNEKGMAIKTGLHDLDKILGGGLFPGDMIVMGARPGMGKTSMLQCISNHVAQTDNVLFCSAEMNVEGLSDRDVAGHIGVPIETLRTGGFSMDVMADINNEAIPYIGSLKVYHIDLTRTQVNTANIYQTAYELKNRLGLSLIVVDYLGLLTDKYGNNNNDRLGYISRNLKQVALSMDIPVMCAHQLNRGTESREDKRPEMSDLRDSGNIEQDADVVMFLYRENYYKKGADNVTEINTKKVRQGQSNRMTKVLWDEVHHTYLNLAHGQEE